MATKANAAKREAGKISARKNANVSVKSASMKIDLGRLLVIVQDGVMFTHIEGLGRVIGTVEKIFSRHGVKKIEGFEVELTSDDLRELLKLVR